MEEEKFDEFVEKLKERNEEIRNPKICPICKEKLSIIDDRGGYCTKHYWIVPDYYTWIKSFAKFVDNLAKGFKSKNDFIVKYG